MRQSVILRNIQNYFVKNINLIEMRFKGTINIFKDNQHLLFTQIIDKIYYFGFFVILARSLDLNSYASIILTFTFANFTTVLFCFGFPIYLQREVALGATNKSDLFTKLFSYNLLLSVPYLVLSGIIFNIVYSGMGNQMLVFLIIFAITSSSELLVMSLLKGMKKYKQIFTLTLFIRIVVIFVIVCIWLNKYDGNIIVFAFLGGNIVYLISLLFQVKKYIRLYHIFNLSLKEAKIYFTVISPLWAAMVFNYLYDKADVFIISKIVTFEQLSFYSIAYGILKSSTITFNFLLIGGLTKVTLFTNNKRGVKLFLAKYSEFVLIISISLFFVLYFGAKNVILFVYTEKFTDAVMVLKVLSFAIIPLALNSLTGVVMNGIGLYKENMYVTIFGFLFNIIANIIVLPIYGIIGAAYITIVTEIIILTGDLFFIKHRDKI